MCPGNFVKFIYSEKATKFCEISTVDLSYVVPVKSTVEILQNVVAFSEYMNFSIIQLILIKDANLMLYVYMKGLFYKLSFF